MTNKNKKLAKNDINFRLTPKNLKFLNLIVKGVKIPEAHRLAGYSGNNQASYALKNKLKTHLAKIFEDEGVSKDRYLADLLKLLDLPCVDKKTGKPLENLSFDQYVQVRKLLREELPSNKPASHNITAFVIQRYSDDDAKDAKVIDVEPFSQGPISRP